MAGTNEILTWAQGVGANVANQSAYAASGARTGGVSAGVADSSLYNKATRQSAFIVAALSQWLVDQTGGSVLDNGDTANVKTLLTQGVQAVINAILAANGYATVVQLSAQVANLVTNDNSEIAARAAAISAEAATRAANDSSEAAARLAADNAIIALLANYAPFASFVSGAVAQGGYTKMPTNGSPTSQIIIQWGYATLPTGNGDVIAFPTTFPNALGRVVANDAGSSCNVVAAVPNGGAGAAPNFLGYAKNSSGAFAPGTVISYFGIGL